MPLRTRLVSFAAIGALTAGTFALAPTPAQAVTPTPAPTVTYTCTGVGGLSGVAIPLTVTLQGLTDGLTAGTPLQPVVHSGLGEVGKVLSGLFGVLDQVLEGVLGTLANLLGHIFGVPATTMITSTISNLTLQLTDQLGGTVSTLGGQLSSSLQLGQISQDTPLSLVLGGLTGGLTAPAAGAYDVSLPSQLDLAVLGDTVANLGCVVTAVGGVAPRYIGAGANRRVVVAQVTAKADPSVPNPCTAAASNVGSKKTALALSVAPKKVRATRHGRLGIQASYKVNKHGKKLRARGTVLVCDGTTYLGSTTLARGKKVVLLPTLAAGKHRLLVRYAGYGKAKPAAKRIVVKVKR